jgi:hypothetical protein
MGGIKEILTCVKKKEEILTYLYFQNYIVTMNMKKIQNRWRIPTPLYLTKYHSQLNAV